MAGELRAIAVSGGLGEIQRTSEGRDSIFGGFPGLTELVGVVGAELRAVGAVLARVSSSSLRRRVRVARSAAATHSAASFSVSARVRNMPRVPGVWAYFLDPPSPVPEPFAGLLLEHIDQRLNLTTATNPDARWLFPGRRGGQPLTPEALETRLRQHRIPGLHGRTAAIRQLVLQTPAPVVATMLGYNPDHITRLVAEAGGTWTRYAAGDHTPQ